MTYRNRYRAPAKSSAPLIFIALGFVAFVGVGVLALGGKSSATPPLPVSVVSSVPVEDPEIRNLLVSRTLLEKRVSGFRDDISAAKKRLQTAVIGHRI